MLSPPALTYSDSSTDIPNLEKKLQDQVEEISKLKIKVSADSTKVKAMQFETKLLSYTYGILVMLYFFWDDINLFGRKINLF